MNRRRFCLQKGGSQEHICLITIMFCFNEFAFTVQVKHKINSIQIHGFILIWLNFTTGHFHTWLLCKEYQNVADFPLILGSVFSDWVVFYWRRNQFHSTACPSENRLCRNRFTGTVLAAAPKSVLLGYMIITLACTYNTQLPKLMGDLAATIQFPLSMLVCVGGTENRSSSDCTLYKRRV